MRKKWWRKQQQRDHWPFKELTEAAPVIRSLADQDIELDQKLFEAFRSGYVRRNALTSKESSTKPLLIDSGIFMALTRLSAISARVLDFEAIRQTASSNGIEFLLAAESQLPPWTTEKLEANEILLDVLNYALLLRREPHTLGSRDFLRSVLNLSFFTYSDRPLTTDLLVSAAGTRIQTGVHQAPPEVRSLLNTLMRLTTSSEDFEYFVALEEDRVVFRLYSVVDDIIQRTPSGVLLPQRLLLTHFQDTFGCFTHDEIEELESLMNSSRSRERDSQAFFERHPHFLRRWDMREVYPHVFLSHDDYGTLVPDFILTDRELQRAVILELKLPRARIIRRQHNRDRFAACIQEACAQLLMYRDWFRNRHNRLSLRERLGLEIYEPRLAVLVGRSSEFVDDFDRQRLNAMTSDRDICTYDDILTFARRRRILVRGT